MTDKPGKQFGDAPGLLRRLAEAPGLLRRHLKGKQLIGVDYRVSPRVRYGHGLPANPYLARLIEGGRGRYATLLRQFLAFDGDFARIPARQPADPRLPYWTNTYIPALDGISIYAMLAIHRPTRLLEIGSGNSTKFARRAIGDHGLATRITSLDPLPRAECDALCDHIVRSRLEDADLAVFDDVQPGDVVYMDGSHRCFQNSDVTVFFLEVLPRLRPGVIVGVHDIFLPEDYPPQRMGRFYSEQYVMAAYMLGQGDRLEILLPNHFVSRDQELSGILAPLASVPSLAGVPIEGWLIWFRKT